MHISTFRFTPWTPWAHRNTLAGIESPGVYAICVSASSLAGAPFRVNPEICYFGMTNSRGGLRSRLKQFDHTLEASRPTHGGADRFRFVHRAHATVLPKLYVAICPVEADPEEPTPRDLRAMGSVAHFEYECLARYLAKFGELPQFNRRSSPKHSAPTRKPAARVASRKATPSRRRN